MTLSKGQKAPEFKLYSSDFIAIREALNGIGANAIIRSEQVL